MPRYVTLWKDPISTQQNDAIATKSRYCRGIVSGFVRSISWLPGQLRRKEFSDQFFVEGLQAGHVGARGPFAVEVIGVECPDPAEHFAVAVVHQAVIGPFRVPRIERVIADH